jgi:two-component system, OmpR family, sensor histidine kinase MprB
MSLRFRIAVMMAMLVAATAAVVATAGYQVTADRLDSEINSSIAVVTDQVSSSPIEARRTCDVPVPSSADDSASGTDDDGDDRASRPSRRQGRNGGAFRAPRNLIVQCIDAKGEVLATSPSSLIAVDDADLAVAAGSAAATRTSTQTIEDDRHRVVTVRAESIGAVQVARSLEERDRVLSSLLGRSAALASGATVLAALVGLLIATRIARPIRRLTLAAEAIGSSGRFDVDLDPTHRRDETGRLSRSFAQMVESLQRSRDEQARLVQDAGHELRTPLTSLRANVSLLRRADLPDHKRAGILADLDSELRELTALTNELVALAAHGSNDERAVPLDIAALIDEAMTRWARRGSRTINASLGALTDSATAADRAPTGALVTLPPTAATRLIDNIMSNAMKFSPEGSAIDVTHTSDAATTTFTVRDRGPGIAPADLPHVFERFYRSDEARAQSGSGLGLSIVHDIVMRAGGTVTADNHPDGGARFTVVLPRTGD